MGETHTRQYRHGVLVADGFPLDAVADHVGADDEVVCIDLCDPTREQLHLLADQLGLHDLAVEDALEPHQRPKVDHYPSHLYLSCHAVRVDRETRTLRTTEINAFVNRHWLITVRKDEGFPMTPVLERWDRSPDLCASGVSFLLYALLDEVVDGYFDAISVFDDYYDEVSEGIFADQPLNPTQTQHWFQMRRALVHLHRLVVPLREAISTLTRREQGTIADELVPYFVDVYDHTLRLVESTDALRDLVSTIVETNLSLRDYRQNQVMKKVTSWAAIIAVPTLVTGWYGMNVPFPGSGEDWGVWMAAALVALLSVGLFTAFRKREWL
jgi:magnesium transporter